MAQSCPCGSGNTLENCCNPYITGKQPAPTPEALMRSRYTAYTLAEVDYIYNTTAPSERKYNNKRDILSFAKNSHWVKLEVLEAKENIVEFKAYFLNASLKPEVLHERSLFVHISGAWYYKHGTHY